MNDFYEIRETPIFNLEKPHFPWGSWKAVFSAVFACSHLKLQANISEIAAKSRW